MPEVMIGEVSAEVASQVQNRVYQIQSAVSDIIRTLDLDDAEELLKYCQDFAAQPDTDD